MRTCDSNAAARRAGPRARGALPLVACALAVLGLTACGTFNDTTHKVADALTLYKPEVVQGNFVSREQLEALRPGMSRLQVRDILGTPLLVSAFHGDRWDYVFTLRRQGVEPQHYHVAVFFSGDSLQRTESDELPSEIEFVEQITPRKKYKARKLEASEEQLQAFERAHRSSEEQAPAPEPVAAGNYPPLGDSN